MPDANHQIAARIALAPCRISAIASVLRGQKGLLLVDLQDVQIGVGSAAPTTTWLRLHLSEYRRVWLRSAAEPAPGARALRGADVRHVGDPRLARVVTSWKKSTQFRETVGSLAVSCDVGPASPMYGLDVVIPVGVAGDLR